MARHLLSWAERGLQKGLEEPHLQTTVFIDAIGRSSRILTAVSPFLVSIARLRFWLHGRSFQADGTPELVRNWNTSEEFLQGAEQAYRHVILATTKPAWESDVDLSRVRPWLEEQQALKSRDFPGSDGLKLTKLLVQFQSLAGPRSLEALQEIRDITRLNKEELKDKLEQDLLSETKLKLDILAIAEAQHPPLSTKERRADRLLLESSFDLREGITSDFTVAEVETLLRDTAENFEE
ncbi:unnamed protein product [Effrenium voratum]|uniref:Uncharacterized protein n=1 Tax=Effrenium voratum TaxID=2562239 RepID=A0AA36IGU2_9DINO|nr:unnamed protein product [Effrenium voratum]